MLSCSGLRVQSLGFTQGVGAERATRRMVSCFGCGAEGLMAGLMSVFRFYGAGSRAGGVEFGGQS